MIKCLVYNLSSIYCYKKYKCRCIACLKYKSNEHREWRKNADKEKIKKRQRVLQLKKYGITLDDYKKMSDLQNGVCAICGKKQNKQSNKENLCVDHDHTTGKVRGLLCVSCNIALGLFRHDAKLLDNSIIYLKENS